ncbi:MAG: type II toxin-antitoxin system HicB family antitoxin [Candidatus Jacksonbacteria bacterium]
MRKLNLQNVIWKEGKDYVSWNLNTGVSSFGDTKQDALDALDEALELYFEDMPVFKAVKVERADLVSQLDKINELAILKTFNPPHAYVKRRKPL